LGFPIEENGTGIKDSKPPLMYSSSKIQFQSTNYLKTFESEQIKLLDFQKVIYLHMQILLIWRKCVLEKIIQPADFV